MSDIAIRVENLSKMYRIGGAQESYRTLRDTLTSTVTAPFKRARSLLRGQAYGAAGLEETIWALKDISFEVKHGEVVGIIGQNGAGKSTLLKVLSRITEPTKGYVDLYGRVGALLEVGTGFHPELTGRENVYLNGAILGMSRDEIDRKFDEIVNFAGVERFIDTPVKYYSSGMGLRLGFAVAAHLEPEILMIDEVLAVGDIQFQQKCLGKMSKVANEGRTVLFVSHNMAAVLNLCNRGIVLQEGSIVESGDVDQAITRYVASQTELSQTPLKHRQDRQGNGVVRFTNIYLETEDGQPVEAVQSGQNIQFVMDYEAMDDTPVAKLGVSIRVFDINGIPLFVLWNEMVNQPFDGVGSHGQFRCMVPRFPLKSGRYTLDIACGLKSSLFDRVHDAYQLEVVRGDFFASGRLPDSRQTGSVLVDQVWSIKRLEVLE